MLKIRDLFARKVTRAIPPVVYFHEQSPQKLADEVSEYIITGGEVGARGDTDGIHDQFVRLLTAIAEQLREKGQVSYPPAVWISGFFGSGKSSFAKLLGLALDGRTLPDGRPLADALIAQDLTPRAADLANAWDTLIQRVDPIAVVFDIGGRNREGEQIHLTILRELRARLGYCTHDSVGEYELILQRDGHYQDFLRHAQDELGQPWDTVRTQEMAELHFSAIMARQFPERFTEPLAWFSVFEQRHASPSASDAARAIADMLDHSGHGDRTLFIVVDEVSQYLQQDGARMLALQSFVSELESRLKGRVWLMATGQEKLEEAIARNLDFGKMKDRFPPRFRVHLSSANIRQVLHKRLLRKSAAQVAALEALYDQHEPDLRLYAHGGEKLSKADFVELYPLLPGWTDLLMNLTSALRSRSSRAQGDDQAIRGLLQLLGEIFRQGLADEELGALVSIDQVYAVQHTALDHDTQQSLHGLREQVPDDHPLTWRVIQAVAILEPLSEKHPVTAEWVARCLYARAGQGNQQPAVQAVLEQLKADNHLAYSEREGFKLQSSAGQEWSDERSRFQYGSDKISEQVSERLSYLLGLPGNPSLKGRSFPWRALFSDGRSHHEVQVKRSTDPGAVTLDLQYLPKKDARHDDWLKQSDRAPWRDRIVWLVGNRDEVDRIARDWARSDYMVRKYQPQRETLTPAKRLLLTQEENNREDLAKKLTGAVEQAFCSGRIYFRGEPYDLPTLGTTFAGIAEAIGGRVIQALFSQFEHTRLLPTEFAPLLHQDPVGLSPKLTDAGLGLFTHENGRYEPTCTGQVPQRIEQHIRAEHGVTGQALIAVFGAPPYGYDATVVRASLAALLRAGRIQVQPEEGGKPITNVRDQGAKDQFERDRAFRAATWAPADDDGLKHADRARIAKFLATTFNIPEPARDEAALADAVESQFPKLGRDLRTVERLLEQCPTPRPAAPPELDALQDALTHCTRTLRNTRATLVQVRKRLKVLRAGAQQVHSLRNALTDAALAHLTQAAAVRDAQAAQLSDRPDIDTDVQAAIDRLRDHLALSKPWIDIEDRADDVAAITTAYAAVRRAILARQGQTAEAARERLKARKDYRKLDPHESNQVLRPITQAEDAHGEDAIRPDLHTLESQFGPKLDRAVEQANDLLDRLLEQKRPVTVYDSTKKGGAGKQGGTGTPPPPVRYAKVRIGLRHQTVESLDDLDALLDDLRERVKAELGPNTRVRLV